MNSHLMVQAVIDSVHTKRRVAYGSYVEKLNS
jgi:hypothetical protein